MIQPERIQFLNEKKIRTEKPYVLYWMQASQRAEWNHALEYGIDRANELASICALNAMAAIKALIGDLDKVQRVVKVVGFVNSAPDFTNHPAVINGASNLLLAAFGDAGIHARSSIGVASLPLDAPVEVELIVEVAD